MLHLILGTAGTGKTTCLLENMKEKLKQGRKVILLVPEQYSFEAEKAVYRAVGPRLALNAEVLSFTRLSNLIFRRYGGLAGNYISDPARCLLMSVALHEVKDQFLVYERHSYSATFLKDALNAVSELKSAGVSPEELDSVRSNMRDAALEDKLHDLSLLYSAYQLFLEKGYADSQDDLMRACDLLEGKPFFEDYVVYIDSFMSFMAGEYRLLKMMFSSCKEVHIALCCDGLYDREEGMGVFSAVKKTAARLVRMAKENGLSAASPILLKENHRFGSPELEHISDQLFSAQPLFYGNADAVKLVSAQTPYEEISFVAQEITRLIREKGYRYRDIAVIARNLSGYIPSLETLFSEYGIPYFLDQRVLIEHQPLISTVLGALEAVRRGFSSEEILNLAKSPVLGLEPEKAFELENYSYLWGIERGMWLQEFKNHPDGFCSGFDEEQFARLQSIEESRRKIMTPLARLKERLQDCDGEGFARAVFSYLEETDAAGQLEKLNDPEADSYWNCLMDLLEQFAAILSHRCYPLSQFVDLFRLMVNSADIGQIPQTADQVTVGLADRVRPQEPKATFVIGVNEGVFPAAGNGSGVFTDNEREILHQNHLELGLSPDQRVMNERFFCYFVLTTPSQKLYVSFSRSTLSGESMTPSVLVRQLQKMFASSLVSAGEDQGIKAIVNERTAYDYYCANAGKKDVFTASLKESLSGTEYEPLLNRSENDQTSWRLYDLSAAKKLAGSKMRLSPSRLERYFKCPFSYFCESELKLKERSRVEYSPIQSGTAIHYVLSMMLSRFTVSDLAEFSQQEMREKIEKILMEYLNQNLTDYQQRPARFKYLFSRLTTTLVRLVSHMAAELSQGKFVPTAFELPISEKEGVRPLVLKLPDGSSVSVEGIVDRVDVMQKGKEKYVRVVDYKSGGKIFHLSDVVYGLNLQLFIYLFSITQSETEGWKGSLPAGALYLPAKYTPERAERNQEIKASSENVSQSFKMNGLVLEDEAVIEGMEREVSGVFIPVKRNKDGSFSKTSSLASLEKMGRLKKHIEQLILQMAGEVRTGRIEAKPSVGAEYNPCQYCPYHSVCQREEDGDCRRLDRMDEQKIWSRMEETGDGSHNG